jgi:hypothetical protein
VHRAAQKGLRQNRIPFESARAQDDTAASTYAQAPSGQGYPHSSDFSGLGNEVFGPRVHLWRHSDIQ